MVSYKTIYKKLLAVGTAAVVMASVGAPAKSEAAVPFTDVPDKYLSSVEYLNTNDIIKGTGGTNFGTNGSMTRGNTAVMIEKALGLEARLAPDAGFIDVSGRYEHPVNTLFDMGVISGINRTTFNPSGTLTRGAMAKILVKAYNIPMAGNDSPFKDATGAFGDYIDAIYAAGITNGVSADSFGSKQEITRGQFAILLSKTINRFGAGCDYDPKSTENPDLQTINCLITEVSRESNYTIPPEIVKAVADKESDWQQFENGLPLKNRDNDGGIGLMQITNKTGYDEAKLGYDMKENIKAGIDFLTNAFYKRTDLPKINNHDPKKLESWYFAVMAYNGTMPKNSPVVQATGARNTSAYQELVYNRLENGNLLDTNIDKLVMTSADFDYDPNSSTPINFMKKSYQLNDSYLTPSKQLFKVGDIVTYEGKGLRAIPSTSGSLIAISPGAKLKIIGEPMVDQNPKSANHFVWYLVEDTSTKNIGYIASYLIK